MDDIKKPYACIVERFANFRRYLIAKKDEVLELLEENVMFDFLWTLFFTREVGTARNKFQAVFFWDYFFHFLSF